ncbi:MAG: hypothetical protein H7836_18240, partial [Magnetococcus sp. YQC-3]
VKKPCMCKASLDQKIIHFTPILKRLARAKNPSDKRKIFKENSPDCITKFASDCSGAILRENIELPKRNIKKLSKHKNLLLYLADKNKSLKRKRSKLARGGFFGLLSILGGILANTVLPLIIDKIRGK